MKLRTTRKQTPRRIVLYGQQGVGKSTLATLFPDPVFVDCEGSTEEMDGQPAYDCASIGDVEAALKLAKIGPHKTVVVDTVDWCEHQKAADMLARDDKKSLEDYGFGKGYVKLGEEMMEFLALLDGLRAAGKHVVLLAHSKVAKFTPPDAVDGYDRYQMKLSKQFEPLAMEWADAVLFMHYDAQAVKKENRVRGVKGKGRLIRTQHCATANAKNRFGWPEIINVDFGELPKEFAAIFDRPVIAEARGEARKSEALTKADGVTVDEIASETLAKVRAAIKGSEDKVARFLIGRGEVKEGEGVEKLPPDYLARILRNPRKFLQAVADETPAAPASEETPARENGETATAAA